MSNKSKIRQILLVFLLFIAFSSSAQALSLKQSLMLKGGVSAVKIAIKNEKLRSFLVENALKNSKLKNQVVQSIYKLKQNPNYYKHKNELNDLLKNIKGFPKVINGRKPINSNW